MRTRLSHLFVLVSDLAKARHFCVDDLGLQVLMEEPGYIRVGSANGFHMGIEEGAPAGAGAPGIEIEVDDVDRCYEEMQTASVSWRDG